MVVHNFNPNPHGWVTKRAFKKAGGLRQNIFKEKNSSTNISANFFISGVFP
jgi:hypothetical protein